MSEPENCKHGLTKETCSFCQGGKPTEFGTCRVVWIRNILIDQVVAGEFSREGMYSDWTAD